MLRSRQLVLLLGCLCVLLVACSAYQAQEGSRLSGLSTPDNTGEQTDNFEISTWFDEPNPTKGETIILIGNIKINGYQQAGVMMEASWPGEAQDRKEPSCVVPVVYQRGVCYIDTTKFSTGETVTVKLKFRYNASAFTGETSFTVR